MSLQDLHLSIMAFPQRWDGAHLDLSVLLLPVGDPLSDLTTGGPAFAGTQLHLQAALIPSLDNLPVPAAPGTADFVINTPVPPDAIDLFKQLPGGNTVVASAPRSVNGVRIKKALPQTYIDAFRFEQPRTSDAVVGDEFGCAIVAKDPGVKNPPPPKTTTWGQLLSFALRQPVLARALGLLYDAQFTLTPADLLKDGGWLYVTLDAGNPANPWQAQWSAQPDLIKSYAARLPALGAKGRPLFAAVLFPVVATIANPAPYDIAALEASDYDDGFAKIVHCTQPTTIDAALGNQSNLAPATDAGIQVGWDDEQVTIWNNRQLDTARDRINNTTPELETPLGVIGYRMDVREQAKVKKKWNSLTRGTGKIKYGPLEATFDGEAAIEPAPIRSQDPSDQEAWLPRYFAQWRGKSLVVSDDAAYLLTGGENPLPPSFLTPILPAGLHLLYGHTYEFRTRLADLTGGGPLLEDDPINPAPAPVTACDFRRHIPPKSVRIVTDPPAPKPGDPAPAPHPMNKVQVWRPLLGYPEFTFAGVTDPSVVTKLLAQVATAKASKDVLGVNDPDVDRLHIVVEVRSPANDTGGPDELDGPFRIAYELERKFPALPSDPLDLGPALELDLDFQDIAHIDDLKGLALGETDPLPIPTARDVRLRLTPLCADRPDYYGDLPARTGLTTDLTTRADATAEEDLFVPNVDARQLNVILLQPADNLPQRLAQQLDLAINGLTFSGKPGRRVAFGASLALRHTLAPDHSAITFAALGELLNHWVAVILLDLDRDWTWDGLADEGLEVSRDGAPVGALQVIQTLDAGALKEGNPPDPKRRDVTHLVFFDAVDPNPLPGKFPRELKPSWTALPFFKGGLSGATQSRTLSLTLPVAAAPRQTPKIVSAGLALSPYQAALDYSSTQPRQKALWLEFEEPVLDPKDTLFARLLAYGPDPLLAPIPLPEPVLPPLSIDPELIRVIVPGQSADNAGLDAMTPLVRSASSDRTYLLPLPPGIDPEALELFGFWTYEFRIGHFKEWSTAQARYGRPLQVSGLQHPAPTLTVTANRQPAEIIATAPFATPVLNGQNLLTNTFLKRYGPRTTLWVLLYAQVWQADGLAHRNILLVHKPAEPIFTNPDLHTHTTRDVIGQAVFSQDEIQAILQELSLPLDSPLSVLAVEMLPGGTDEQPDPLGQGLGQERILRTSPLTPVPEVCLV